MLASTQIYINICFLLHINTQIRLAFYYNYFAILINDYFALSYKDKYIHVCELWNMNTRATGEMCEPCFISTYMNNLR